MGHLITLATYVTYSPTGVALLTFDSAGNVSSLKQAGHIADPLQLPQSMGSGLSSTIAMSLCVQLTQFMS